MGLPPIKYFIVLMLENRSFDHMLGFLKSPDYAIDGLAGNESNEDTTGEPAKVRPMVIAVMFCNVFMSFSFSGC